MSKEAVSKDLQVQMLQEEQGKLKAQASRFQKDIDRYYPKAGPQDWNCRERNLALPSLGEDQ